MTEVTLIVLALLGIWGAVIFDRKNRPAWKGALLGIALGIFGILIAVCLKKRPAAGEEPRPALAAVGSDEYVAQLRKGAGLDRN